jgi:ferritin-like metal-binding protein YciE
MMPEVKTVRALLIMAVRDLHDGECVMADRLGDVEECLSDPATRELVQHDKRRSARQREALVGIARSLDATTGDAENIWLRAILDDADNDCATIAEGGLRDIALVGALRKAKQSQRVSYETAIVLARQLKMRDAVTALRGMAEGADATDTALARALVGLGADA